MTAIFLMSSSNGIIDKNLLIVSGWLDYWLYVDLD